MSAGKTTNCAYNVYIRHSIRVKHFMLKDVGMTVLETSGQYADKGKGKDEKQDQRVGRLSMKGWH